MPDIKLIGKRSLVYFVIRHKETKQLMPSFKRGSGHTHWNPSVDKEVKGMLQTPRLFKTDTSAKKAIGMWAALPNLILSFNVDLNKGYERVDDGRKKEDLEVVEVIIQAS